MASGHADGSVKIWDSQGVQVSLQAHSVWVSDVAWNGSHLLASVGYDGFLKVLDLRSPSSPLFSSNIESGSLFGCSWAENSSIWVAGKKLINFNV